jgi:hypothetical protein
MKSSSFNRGRYKLGGKLFDLIFLIGGDVFHSLDGFTGTDSLQHYHFITFYRFYSQSFIRGRES